MPPEDISPALRETDPPHATRLARQVLAALQSRASAPVPDPGSVADPKRLQDLVEAVLDPAHFDARACVDNIVAQGVPHAELSDVLIPTGARHLGTCWCDSGLSFSSVTIAAGRLQEMLGELARYNDHLSAGNCLDPSILVLSMRGDQHTLGWKLVTLQLRRLGYSAHAAPGVTAEEGAALIEQAPYDLVLVSASHLEAVGHVNRMADVLRARMEDIPTIVVGGLVCDSIDEDCDLRDDVSVTTSLQDALRRGCRRDLLPARRAMR